LRVRLITRRRSLLLAATALTALVALNVLAFMHARSMTRFVDAGPRPSRPDEMSRGEKLKALFFGVNIPKPRNTATPADHYLTFETLCFPTARGLECEAWHVPCDGAKGICLLFHGYASSKESVLDTAEAWHALGYDALLVDFHGSGGSTGNDTTVGYHEADDVAAALDYARTQWPDLPQVLYGWSMGSAAILRALAVHGVEPVAVVLECPFDRLRSAIANRCELVGIPAFPVADLLVFWGGVQQGYSGFGHNPVDYATKVECPVLMLQGRLDRRVTPEQAKAVFDNLRCRKQLVWFDDVAHGPFLAGGAELWRLSVEDFLVLAEK